MENVEIVEIHGDKMQYVQNLLPLHYHEKDNEIILAAVERKEKNELAFCGVLIILMNGVSSEVVHIEVAQRCRRKGIATQLLDYFIHIQFEIGEVWPITISYVDGDDTQEFVSFIENRNDFDIQYECIIYHVQADERESSVIWQKLQSLEKQAELFMKLPPNVQNRFKKKIEAKGIPYLRNVNFEQLEPFLCYCVQKDGEIVAALFIQCENEQELEILFLYADPEYPLELGMVCASAIKAIDAMYPEATLSIVAVEEKADIFVKHMFPQCRNKEAVCRAVWNYNVAESEANYGSASGT